MSDRRVNALLVAAIALGLLWAFLSARQPPVAKTRPFPVVVPEMVPLVTGEEETPLIFTRAGCPVCHRIPGIAGADGRVGPPLLLGTTGPQRLHDSQYRGRAKTVHEYIVESVVEPGAFVVAGYPPETMPTWYGAKLSALALEKIAAYLEAQTGGEEAQGK
jgi:mono/diheme cytochrome c family protein